MHPTAAAATATGAAAAAAAASAVAAEEGCRLPVSVRVVVYVIECLYSGVEAGASS